MPSLLTLNRSPPTQPPAFTTNHNHPLHLRILPDPSFNTLVLPHPSPQWKLPHHLPQRPLIHHRLHDHHPAALPQHDKDVLLRRRGEHSDGKHVFNPVTSPRTNHTQATDQRPGETGSVVRDGVYVSPSSHSSAVFVLTGTVFWSLGE